MKQKTQVDDIDRERYDFRFDEDPEAMLASGITPEIIEEISEEKDDPEWMRKFRLHALEIFARTEMPNWGPSITVITWLPCTTHLADHAMIM